MEITGSIEINASRETVGNLLSNPEKVVECVPGIQSYELSGNEFKSKVKVKVGMISGTFKVEGKIDEVKKNEEYKVTMKGRSMGNSFDAVADVYLSDAGEGKTRLDYRAVAKLSGMLAALGKGIIENVTKNLLDEMFQCIEKKAIS